MNQLARFIISLKKILNRKKKIKESKQSILDFKDFTNNCKV